MFDPMERTKTRASTSRTLLKWKKQAGEETPGLGGTYRLESQVALEDHLSELGDRKSVV